MDNSVAWWGKYLGKPYQFGSTGDSFDCLTLILSIVKERFGIDPKPLDVRENWAEYDRDRYWKESLRYGSIIAKYDHIKEGDVVLFRFKGFPSHAGFMVDRHRFIHILENDLVRIDHISTHPWKNRFWGAVRVGI